MRGRQLSAALAALMLTLSSCSADKDGGVEDSAGSGGQALDGTGGRGSSDICGPQGPLPADTCAPRRECFGSVSYMLNNPFGENCVCELVPFENCALGCDVATGLCRVLVEEGIGGQGGVSDAR